LAIRFKRKPKAPNPTIPAIPSQVSTPVFGFFLVIAEAVATPPWQKQVLSAGQAGFRQTSSTQANPA
jgi:hypothetical protein